MAEPLTREQDMLAAELALGLLEGEERTGALRLVLADPAFAAAVDAWRARLDPLCDDFAEATPPDLWPAIEARLAAQGNGDTVRQLRFWRWSAIGSGAVAASLAAAMLLLPGPDPVTVVREVVRAPDQVAVAQLGGEAGALLAANYDPGEGTLRIRAIDMPQSELAPELWVIPADGVPRSLGLVGASGTTRVAVPARLRALIIDGATLAITMEPVAGAPHAAPSSAPVAAGKISKI
ncbi:anti-sigma factor [Sphingomonas sp. MG17]|uniref:Anti-sigma factor n=1 Tax=Sphingomonas tagetis TaxID=2949092 RepID=A0A9X2HN22_9SPHN|nr:anti-sigma factor [Sphingomonas tagetis]MCP3728850.1 anti-sigma factor [Sphingomonas tagetis]